MKYIMRRIIGGLAVLSVSLLAGTSSKAMIIFDASGSMWGQIDGVNKIVIARDALKSVVQKWNPKVQLGLTVYGHRVKGDCNDIQTVIPIGPVHKKQMIDTVMGIMPKGMTPISKSLRQVAGKLRSNEGQTTIILISDGRESCDADPCATAKQLKAEGINFVAHVVGFNVNATTDTQLACIAHATGGEYFSAKNAAALNKAIKVIAKKVAKPKPRPKALTQTTLHLVARYQMSPTGADVSGMHWEVTQGGQILYTGDKAAPEMPAKVGKVHIKAAYSRASKAQKVEGDVVLKAQKKNTITIQLKSGKVNIDAVEEQGGPKVKASVHIYPIIDGTPTLSDDIAWCVPTPSKSCERILPVGDFFLRATYNDMKTEKRFSLKKNEKKSLHLYFKQTGVVKVSASEKEGGKWIDASCRIYNKDKTDSWSISPRKKESSMSIEKLPVGKYTLNCAYNAFKRKNIPVEVKAGETTKVHVVFGQTGTVKVSASEKEGGKWIDASCRIYNKDKTDSWFIGPRKKKPGTRQLPVGKYQLKCSYNAFKKEMPFEIKAGETVKVHVLFGHFVIQPKCAKPNERVVYEIYASNGQMVFEKRASCSQPLKLSLPNGSYTVEATVTGGKGQAKFTIGSGHPDTLILDLNNLTHQAEIQADTVSVTPVAKSSSPVKKQPKANDLGQMLNEATNAVNAHKGESKKAGEILNALGGLLGNTKAKEKQAPAAEPAKDEDVKQMSDGMKMLTD